MLEIKPSDESILFLIEYMAQRLSDSEAIMVPDLFPRWNKGVDYSPNGLCIVKLGNPNLGYTLYRCTISHRSNTDNSPRVDPTIWRQIL